MRDTRKYKMTNDMCSFSFNIAIYTFQDSFTPIGNISIYVLLATDHTHNWLKKHRTHRRTCHLSLHIYNGIVK